MSVTDNPWSRLRAFTDARIGIGRAGVSLPTAELLAFQLAHAQARDAVHLPLDVERLVAELGHIAGLAPAVVVKSQAADRGDYLRHPDRGRRLADGVTLAGEAPDLALVIADGLSARAVQDNAPAMAAALVAALPGVRVSAPVIVRQGRVAVGDAVGAGLGARAVVMLIGERPGLSSPDSLGLYYTFAPQVGLTDARRNCISNIRPAGLGFGAAAARLAWLHDQACRMATSGVAIKDRTTPAALGDTARSFLSPPEGD